MANKKKKAVTKKSSRKKKATPPPKKKAVKKTVKKRAVVKASKPVSKKKTVKKAAGKSVKKAAPKAGPPNASAKKIAGEEDVAPRKSMAAKPAMPMEPADVDLDEEDEIAGEELDVEGEVEEDDVQEELNLDADDDGDELIEKSEDLLDDESLTRSQCGRAGFKCEAANRNHSSDRHEELLRIYKFVTGLVFGRAVNGQIRVRLVERCATDQGEAAERRRCLGSPSHFVGIPYPSKILTSEAVS